MKKRTCQLGAGLVAVLAISGMFAAQNAQASVVFTFNNGNSLDTTGVDATLTVDGLTITTVEIVGWDGTLASAGAGHQMNSTTANSLGVNSATTPPNAASDARDFDPGEAWIFKFDKDVRLNLFNMSSVDTVTELTISSSAFASNMVFGDDSAGDDYDLGDILVPAGTAIKLQNTSAESTVDDSHDFRITSLTVTVIPEPASLGLIGACAVGAFMIRRFRM